MELKSKKGIYYTLDALLATLLVIGAAILISSNPITEQKIEQKSFASQDLLTSLSELKIEELNNTFINNEIQSGNINTTNNSVLEQAGEFWATNQPEKAQELLELIINDSIPPRLGVKLSIDNDQITEKNVSSKENVVVSKRMIAGIEKGKPLVGSSASAYLKKIRNKKTSSYAYFGGFIGQGNVSNKLILPGDFNSSRTMSAELKIETEGVFELYINNNKCGTTYTGNGNRSVSYWDVSLCNDSLIPDNNQISLRFTSPLNTSFISGGHFKVTYQTDTLRENVTEGYKRYYFPEINGFINIYDAIAAQGLIRNWSLNITFYNEYDTFLTIGNETIFVAPGTNQTQNILYTKLNETLSPTQIPLRLGVINISNVTILDTGVPSDSFLVTDVSGSMGDCAISEDIDEEYCGYEYKFWFWWFYTECPYPGSCSSNECGGTTNTRNHDVFNKTTNVCTSTMLDLAKQADKLFVEIILNDSSLHNIGLVDFATDANPYTDLTNIKSVLDAEIDTYTNNGGTCTCCGINRARTLINDSTNNKFIVVLSDGEPTYKCTSFTDYTGNSGSSAENQQWAIDAGQEACSQNITVYSIGFGESMSETGQDVMKQIACNESLYYDATNVTQLSEIYENISNRVLVAANFTSQTLNVVGNFTYSNISGDSYIDIFYEPLTLEDTQSKVSVVVETDQFNSCNASIYIDEGLSIEDAFITSYSSNHWTKYLEINGIEVFNLTTYGSEYELLGDPFTVQIPAGLIETGGYNNLSLIVGDNSSKDSNCSNNNSLIYTALFNSSTPRTNPLELAVGCNWEIETTSGSFINTSVPEFYNGSNKCTYNSTQISYNENDAYDFAIYDLLRQLDYGNQGRIFIDLDANDLEIIIINTGQIPYMWGPSILRAEVWQ